MLRDVITWHPQQTVLCRGPHFEQWNLGSVGCDLVECRSIVFMFTVSIFSCCTFMHCTRASGPGCEQGLHQPPLISPDSCFPGGRAPDGQRSTMVLFLCKIPCFRTAIITNNVQMLSFISYNINFIYLPTKKREVHSFSFYCKYVRTVRTPPVSEIQSGHQLQYCYHNLKKVLTLPLFSMA